MKRLFWDCECGNVEETKEGEAVIDGMPGDLVGRKEPCPNCKRTMLLVNGDYEKALREAHHGEMPD